MEAIKDYTDALFGNCCAHNGNNIKGVFEFYFKWEKRERRELEK